MIWDTLAFNPNDMRYSCSDVAGWHRSAWLWRMEVDIYRNCPNSEHSGIGASSMSEQVILLGIWFSRFRERCLFDFWASNLVGSVFSNVKKGWPFLQFLLASNIFLHAVTRGNIKLSERELADVEKVLRVPKEDRHLGKLQPLFRNCILYFDFSCSVEKVSKKGGTNDILFHKRARKHRVRPAPRPKSQEEVLKITASKRAEAEAIGCAVAIVARDERRLLPPLPTIDPIFPPTMKSTDQEGDPSSSRKRKYKEEVGSIHWKDLKVVMQPSSFRYVNNFLARCRSTVDKLGEPLDENESDRDRMTRLSSYVMTEYDDRLRENNQLVNDRRKTSKALAELETTILEVSKVKGEFNSALVEVSKLKRSIPTERDAAIAVLERYNNGSIIQKYGDEMDEYRQRGEAFVLAVDPSSEDDSDNEASVGKQSQENKNGSGDTEDGGDDNAVEMQSDIVRGRASDKDDSYLLVIVLQVISVPWMAKGLAIGAPDLFWTQNVACSSSIGTTASIPKASENGVSLVEVRYEVRNGCQGFYFGPLCEVVNCNDCITDLALSCRHWADQIKSLLGDLAILLKQHKMYVVYPDWLRPRSRGVLISCEGFTQIHRFKLSFSEF
ncbi:hypothetical protein D8674_010761 [Pyrus ussuriensis x Pyrus communis]|uniref:Uncharacterized protein n=1 Tax=Pyrus ussuriensis x Pyrus communis TaxID=2448454 RepID=A0A5N5FGZ6_9ROSA|nr:hypothetical protein D8674_010761 [Pyrus ussuriensis x Pyrus communis]